MGRARLSQDGHGNRRYFVPFKPRQATRFKVGIAKTRFSITWFSDMYRGTPPRRSLEASLDSMLSNFVSPASPQSYIKD